MFGDSIALDGDTLAISATQEWVGRIAVFTRGDAGWQRTDSLRPASPPEAIAGSTYVYSLALRGEVLAAGVIPAVADPGQRVHIFERRAGRWEPTARLAGDRPAELFGGSLAFDVVFGPSDAGYAQLHFIKANAPATRENHFGRGLAASGGRVAIGARGEDLAYVFR